MGTVFGTAAVRRVFGDVLLFRVLEGASEVSPGAAPGAELDGDGRRVVQALLDPDPAKRGHADDLVKSNWFLERPVFKRTMSGRGGKGPFTIFEAFMGDDVLAFTGGKALEQGTRARFRDVFSVCLRGSARFQIFWGVHFFSEFFFISVGFSEFAELF